MTLYLLNLMVMATFELNLFEYYYDIVSVEMVMATISLRLNSYQLKIKLT